MRKRKKQRNSEPDLEISVRPSQARGHTKKKKRPAPGAQNSGTHKTDEGTERKVSLLRGPFLVPGKWAAIPVHAISWFVVRCRVFCVNRSVPHFTFNRFGVRTGLRRMHGDFHLRFRIFLSVVCFYVSGE